MRTRVEVVAMVMDVDKEGTTSFVTRWSVRAAPSPATAVAVGEEAGRGWALHRRRSGRYRDNVMLLLLAVVRASRRGGRNKARRGRRQGQFGPNK
jgi:hypothetical protein